MLNTSTTNSIKKNQHRHEASIAVLGLLKSEEEQHDHVWIWPCIGMNNGPKKKKKITMNHDEAKTAIDLLLREDDLLSLFKADGEVKTKKLSENHQELNNIANLVTSAFRTKKISSVESLQQQKTEKINLMKSRIISQNLAENCVTDDASARTETHMRIIKSLVDDVSKKKSPEISESAQWLKASWQQCLKDMQLVDRWAHGVWQKHGVVMEPVCA